MAPIKHDPKPEDVENFKKAMWAKYKEVGIVKMIDFYADAMAYQNNLVEINFEVYKKLAKALRITNKNDRKDRQ